MIIETIKLDTDLCITLLDQTQHYFGGYFHVKVLAFCDVPVDTAYFEDDAERNDAAKRMGTSVRFERVLEKMAVPESAVESVRSQLTRDFHETTVGYLSAADFARRFVRSEYLKRIKKSSPIRSSRA